MDRLEQNNIVKEVRDSFLEYSMSVIVARALPDLRDGLKPVHRRILYSMFESGYTPDKSHKKSARIVGDVMGKYHPHGDSSIYDAMVRMAQDFSYRYMLVDGHGNFGNIQGYGAAAMRYTESRLSKISLELLKDINKNTVNFTPNFDESENEPEVLPSRFPNILVNGTMGIAVGMATNIPPHNLSEVIDGCIAYIENPEIDTMGLMQYVKGPDFPTGAVILGNQGIKNAYETGRGTITIRAKAEIVEENNKQKIVITEIPYNMNTTELKLKVAELVKTKVLDGITDYHSDLKDGIKITITLRRDANANVILNNLYKHTGLQSTYGIIFLMLDKGVPKTLGLRDIISKYVEYQKEIIIRRTQFDLDKALKKAHILEGYKIALDHLDEVIKIIRESSTDTVAKEKLCTKFGLSEVQADAILELKLRRLTGLERDKIEEDLANTLKAIEEYRSILASEEKVLNIIKTEMQEIKDKFGDERRTEIDMSSIEYIEDESLIPEQDIMLVLTKNNYIKRTTTDVFKTQNRGGVGVKGVTTNAEDCVDQIINLSTHDYVMFFTNKGKVYRLKGYEIPEFNRTAKGLPIVNLLQVDKDENISSIIKIKNEEEFKYLLLATKSGIVKKTMISEFDNIRKSGKICITLKENDELIGVKKINDNDLILLGSSTGKLVKFNESEIRCMGRTAAGVKGINTDGGSCICSEVATDDSIIVILSEKGYGKRTKVADFRETKRGSKGVKALNITEKNGNLIGVKVVDDEKELIIMTNSGMTMKMPVSQVSLLGRATQGLRLIHLKDEQLVASLSIVDKSETKEETETENIEEHN